MIHVPRALPEPAALQRRDAQGRTEFERVVAEAEAALEAEGVDLADADRDTILAALRSFDFDYKRYREDDVKTTLTSLFHGKCAYCESFYASTQPMDVEHYRPKGAVQDEDTGALVKPGYYWLASAWLNLLPSCIDCNRSRGHATAEGVVTAGKANRFPLEPGSERLTWHRADPTGDASAERPLILNPCVDQPAEHLDFRPDGVVMPRTERGRLSIEVYGLMRPELVMDRRHVARVIEFRIDLLATLSDLRNRMRAHEVDEDLVLVVEELLVHVFQELEAMTDASRPYAGMARQLIAEIAPNHIP